MSPARVPPRSCPRIGDGARLRRSLLPLALLLGACGPAEEPPLSVSGMTVYEALPGSSAAVAYFTLRNGSESPLLLHEVSSPEFRAVEMHATVFEEGVASMLLLDSLTVAERSEIEFAAGGSHLMLMDPHRPPAPGDLVTLEFHYQGAADAGAYGPGVLVIDAPVRSRVADDVH